MWEEIVFLRHVADRPIVWRYETRYAVVLPHVAVEPNDTGVGAVESGQASHDRRPSASGRAEESNDARIGRLKLHVQIEIAKAGAELNAERVHSRGVSNRRFNEYTKMRTVKLNTSRPAASVCASAYSNAST